MMMKITILIIIVSANCAKMNCEEELNTTENVNGVSEKTQLKSGDNEALQSKTENKENEKDASKASEVNEEIRISRSSPQHSSENVSQSDDFSTSLITEASLTEKSTLDEIISEKQGNQVDKEVKQSTRRTNSPDATIKVEKSSENVEKQLEESPETSRSASETEDRKPADLSEASSESKLSDSEKASSNVDVTDRKSKNEKIKEKSDELILNESRGTRRMFSATDNIVVDTKMRAGTTEVKPEVKTALKPNFNTYNNYNEFGTDRNIKLIDSTITEPSTIIAKTNMPVVTKLAHQEILHQEYKPKINPRPELGINFPNLNSDYQGPRDLPIYLKVKQDETQSPNQFIGPQISQFKSVHESTFFHPNNQQQYYPPQKSPHTQGIFPNKQFENSHVETRNQAAKLYQNQAPTGIRGFIDNKQFPNLNRGSQNQIHQHYQNQEKNPNFKNFGNINLEVRNEDVQEMSKMLVNNNDPGNQYPYHQPQGMRNMRINLENKQLGTEYIASPNTYLQRPSPQLVVLNDPRNKNDIIPVNIKILFQKLASASLFPRKLSTTLQRNNIVKNPYSINPRFTADFSIYGNGYMPGF